MATQIVMDHTGDSRHHFNPRDAKSLLKAEQRFKELTGSGFTAAVRTATGDPSDNRAKSRAAKFIYGPGTHEPDAPGPGPAGWSCFVHHLVCVPDWNYRLSGVPATAAAVTVYAWDWAGNVSARTSPV